MRPYSGKEFVMQNGGFFEKPRTSSTGLGVVIAGHAALLITIALNPTIVKRSGDWIQRVESIPEDPIPPIDPPPTPTGETKAEPTPVPTGPVIDIGIAPGPVVFDPPVIDPGPIPLPQPQEPVFRRATMDPKAFGRFQPPYPSAMVRAGIEGSVTVKVLIGPDGRVRAVELVSTTNPAFFDTTRDHALRAWRFQPATRDGIATESWRTMTVRFRLES